jgi:hypothetical protein
MLAAECNAAAFRAPCATKHTRSFDDVTVAAENKVTPHVGTSLNYSRRAFFL